MLNKKSDAKNLQPRMPPRSKPKGAAPELNSHVPTESSVTINQEVIRGVNANQQRMEYDMPSKNYFNHLDGSTEG